MATYSNQHWLLSHIRNSFISTDHTGMCETVMVSDDLPKHYLKKHQSISITANGQHRKTSSDSSRGATSKRSLEVPLRDSDFVSYPGLDQSDDEDTDFSSQSFDIQIYPEVGSHRLRSNTAQKLEKMDIARRKAARTKCINFDDEIVQPKSDDFFTRKVVPPAPPKKSPTKVAAKDTDQANNSTNVDDGKESEEEESGIKSLLSLQLANSPKQSQNKFMEYACFDGTSQTGILTKRINVFLAMLPERERNYPIKICVIASAKIIEVIGLICYKASIQFPDIPLKSIGHYALYMTEDDDMEDFPPLDNREPCSKFGFSHLTLSERRPLPPVMRIDYHNMHNNAAKSLISEEDRAKTAATQPNSVILLNGSGGDEAFSPTTTDDHISDFEERMLSHNDMVEAPLYRTYRLYIIEKTFFKTEVTLGISGERIEIDQQRHVKFWTKQKAITYPVDSVAFCEIIDRRHIKATLRIWIKSATLSLSPSKGYSLNDVKGSSLTSSGSSSSFSAAPLSPSSPRQYPYISSSILHNKYFQVGSMRFKHYDFESDVHIAEQILNKLSCILKVRSSEVHRVFQLWRERKLEKQFKKQFKL